jgi:hypothetical protein
MFQWIKCIFLALALIPVLGILFLFLASSFLKNPQRTIVYHPPSQAYSAATVSLPLPIVREKIILLIDPSSALLSQPTLAEREAQESDTFEKRNAEALKCLIGTEQEQSDCQQLADATQEDAVAPSPKIFQSPDRFSIDSIAKLREMEQLSYSATFNYEQRGFLNTGAVLEKYLAQSVEETKNDLWLSEDIDLSGDLLSMRDTTHLNYGKYAPLEEYTVSGKGVFGTSDYIIHLKAINENQTQIDLIPLFPRIIVGKRYEDSMHAGIAPRFIYDVRPVEKFDEERIKILQMITQNIQ